MSSLPTLGPIAVVDLGAVEVSRPGDGTVVIVRAGGRLLGVHTVPAGTPDADAVFATLDTIAGSALLDVDCPSAAGFVRARIGWLNPFTAAVSVDVAASGLVFGDHEPVVCDGPLTVATLAFDASGRKVLSLADRDLPAIATADVRALTRVLAAHP